MIKRIKPFNTIICGLKKIDGNICINLPSNIFYAFDIYSGAILIALAEADGEVEQTAFISYISETLKGTNIFNSDPQFYTTTEKTIINSHYKINDLSKIYTYSSIKKGELNNILESITHLFRDQILPKVVNLYAKERIKLTEIIANIHLLTINYNFFNKKIRFDNKTSFEILTYSAGKKISFEKEKNYSNILSLSPIKINLNRKEIFEFNKNDDAFCINNHHNKQIFDIKDHTIKLLEKKKEQELKKYHSDKNNEENIRELLDIFDKQLIINRDEKQQAKFIMNKLKILKKMGRWDESIILFKEILNNFKRKNYGTEIDRVQFLLLYSTLLIKKMDYEEAIKQLKLSVLYSKKNNYNEGLFESYIQLAHTNFNKRNNSTAREYFNKAKEMSINLDDKDKYLLLNLYNIETVKYFEEKKIKKAINSTKDYLNLAKELKNIDKIYHAYCNLALLFNNLGYYNRALHFAQKQIKIAEREKSEPKLVASYGNFGNIYNLQKEFKKARVYFKRELILAKKIGATPRTLQALVGIVDCDLQRKIQIDTEKYCLDLIKISENNNFEESLGIGYFFLGQICLTKRIKKKKQMKISLNSFRKAKDIFLKLNITERLVKLDDFLKEKGIVL